jgi:hypothetical protein
MIWQHCIFLFIKIEAFDVFKTRSVETAIIINNSVGIIKYDERRFCSLRVKFIVHIAVGYLNQNKKTPILDAFAMYEWYLED